jgi:hypothetical protein
MLPFPGDVAVSRGTNVLSTKIMREAARSRKEMTSHSLRTAGRHCVATTNAESRDSRQHHGLETRVFGVDHRRLRPSAWSKGVNGVLLK